MIVQTSFTKLHTTHHQFAKAIHKERQPNETHLPLRPGIPTRKKAPGMAEIPHLKIHATDHASNPFCIQWMLYGRGCKLPNLVRKMPHAAFEVDEMKTALKGRKVIIKPNSPSPGVLVAFIEEAGLPIELLQLVKKRANTGRRTN